MIQNGFEVGIGVGLLLWLGFIWAASNETPWLTLQARFPQSSTPPQGQAPPHQKNLTKLSPIPSSHSNLWSFPRPSLHQTSMVDPSSSHNKSHRALSLTLNPSSVSLSSWPKLSLNPCSLISKSLSNELHGHPSQAYPLTAMGFIFLRSCFMGFIFCGFGCGFIWFPSFSHPTRSYPPSQWFGADPGRGSAVV